MCTTKDPRVLAAAVRPRSLHHLLAPRSPSRFHSSHDRPAKVVPVAGPDSAREARIVRRRKQADMLRLAKNLRAAARAQMAAGPAPQHQSSRTGALLRKRFWKDVHVKEVEGAYEVHLDSRPLRRPDNKEVIRLPLSKPLLAHALALEWDHIMSAAEATKQHLIPLTSLTCRALDIRDDDAGVAPPTPAPVRTTIAATVLRYLDTDSLLCWAPPAADAEPSLRARQEAAARPVVDFLARRVWPAAALVPALDAAAAAAASLVPPALPPATRAAVRAWVLRLGCWELAGLERAVLAGKGLLAAARLVAEWSEHGAGVVRAAEGAARFGVEEAARAASVEVDWQTRRWGEVEDSHDVEKADLRRQLGSVVVLVSGRGKVVDGDRPVQPGLPD